MSGPIDQGQTYRYRFPVKNAAGVLTNAGSVTVTITLPDGTTTNPTVVNAGPGLYDIAYTTSQVGLHTVRGVASGGVLGSEVDAWEDVFTAEQPARMFISVDEASQHLRASGIITSDADREQLRWLCMVASETVERDLGRIVSRRSIVETYDGASLSEISLRSTPVISIASIVEAGNTLTGIDYLLDTDRGVVYRGTTVSSLPWAYGRRNVVITYTAGFVNPPRSLRIAALNLVQEMWQTSQQAPHPLITEEFAEGLFSGAVSGLTQRQKQAYESYRAHGVA